jgi:DNA-binding LytR/AlgR family response regulator
MDRTIHCLIVDDELIAREVLEKHLADIGFVYVVGSCKNAVEAINVLSSEKVDLIFLDISMPEISGLALAKTINPNIKVIFTTAYREYAVEGFDLQAVDYLLKPISCDRLLQAIYKYRGESGPEQDTIRAKDTIAEKSDYFYIRADRKMVRINFPDVLYIESLADYVKIHMEGKTVVTRDTLSGIESRLPHNDFIRIHRSFIVSIGKIDSFTSEFVEIAGDQLPISRSYKREVLLALDKWSLSAQ